MKIGRYPKMMALQYWRAIKLGYDNNKAKSIAVAEATKYAIFKNRGGWSRGKRKYNTSENKGSLTIPQITQDKTFRLYWKEGLPFVGGKQVYPEEFDTKLLKYNKLTRDKLLEWAKSKVENADEKDLKIETRFFNNVYKPVRDEEI